MPGGTGRENAAATRGPMAQSLPTPGVAAGCPRPQPPGGEKSGTQRGARETPLIKRLHRPPPVMVRPARLPLAGGHRLYIHPPLGQALRPDDQHLPLVPLELQTSAPSHPVTRPPLFQDRDGEFSSWEPWPSLVLLEPRCTGLLSFLQENVGVTKAFPRALGARLRAQCPHIPALMAAGTALSELSALAF